MSDTREQLLSIASHLASKGLLIAGVLVAKSAWERHRPAGRPLLLAWAGLPDQP